MLKAYKTEINPTDEQKEKILRTIGTCRYVYNFFISHNQQIYANGGKYISGFDFSKWLNNDFLPQNPDKSWICEVSSKSVKQSILNADKAFKKFFDKKAGFPRFKKKGKNDSSMYFVKTDSKTVIRCERHRIKIPTIGWIRLKEKGYIPTDSKNFVIKSGTISVKAGRFYVSVLIDQADFQKVKQTGNGIGIDLGLKDFAVLSDGRTFENINKTHVVRRLEKKLKRKQRSLSRKYEALKERKGENATRQNIQKNLLEVQKLFKRLENIRTDYINKIVNKVAKTKPKFVTIEDLNVKGMMKNRHLSKAISKQKFFEFRTKLTSKCKIQGIELRIANRFYPSSKKCSCCGKLKNIKLSERVYKCECGNEIDRDFNASINLKNCEDFEIA
ncbi:MAG: transposase [Bacteroidales bacterium]|nr:transposase [Candidatus Scybalousia scybalohippi]